MTEPDPIANAVGGPTVRKDDAAWLVGTQDEVRWINDATGPGLAITAGVPPRYRAYATVTIAEDHDQRHADETLLVQLLDRHASTRSWWLGYLDTGAHDVVFDEVPRVTLYTGWSYVLVQAGPTQAAAWRVDNPWRGRLPDLIFPVDRSWMVTMLWDDDWRCVGGPDPLVRDVVEGLAPRARRVGVDVEATPPGHTAR